MRSLIFAATLLFLAGCVTKADFQKTMDSWIGTSEKDLIAQMGPPDGFYESSGTRYLTYSNSSVGVIPGTPPTYTTNVIGNTAYTNSYGGTSPTVVSYSCSRTFQVEGGKIVSWSAKGNNCYDF
jgi:hypothetical protein